METIRLLIIDDEKDFRRATSQVLSRRGFRITEAEDGKSALAQIAQAEPDVILLDLKMPGIDGITTLEEIRQIAPSLPVIILTGHGKFEDAFAGISLEVVDFVQKPIDVEWLSERIRQLIERDNGVPLREKRLDEVISPIRSYQRVFDDENLSSALATIKSSISQMLEGKVVDQRCQSMLVYSRKDQFVGMLRAHDIIKGVLPLFLGSSPYSTYFTGMFLAQTKVMGSLLVGDLMDSRPPIDIDVPLMEAVHTLVSRNVVNLPVAKDGEVVGLLTGRNLLLEISTSVLGA